MVLSCLRGLMLGVVLLVGAGAQAARAGVVNLGPDDDLSYVSPTGEVNRVRVTLQGRTVVLSDAGAPISIGRNAGCARDSPNVVRCARPSFLRVGLGDHDDAARVTGLVARELVEVDGGPGDDRIIGGSREEELRGGAGNDLLAGGGAFDDLDGGAGNDRLRGGVGADQLRGGRGRDDLGGGAGNDTVAYGDESGPASVTLDGRANDGARGERDWVRRDVEGVSSYRGRIVGNSGPNDLAVDSGIAHGGGGDDFVQGSGKLYGDAGNDRIFGAGDVTAYGGPGKDRILAQGGGRYDGGAGDDVIDKDDDAAAAVLFGGSGNDRIDSRDMRCEDAEESSTHCEPAPVRDRISCGPGRDAVVAGIQDIVAGDCERITQETQDPASRSRAFSGECCGRSRGAQLGRAPGIATTAIARA